MIRYCVALCRAVSASLAVLALAAPVAAQPAQPATDAAPDNRPRRNTQMMYQVMGAYNAHVDAVRECNRPYALSTVEELRVIRNRVKKEHDRAVAAGEFAALDVASLALDLDFADTWFRMAQQTSVKDDCVKRPRRDSFPPPPPLEPATPAPVVSQQPAAPPPVDPFDAGRAMVDSGAAAVPSSAITAVDLIGTWLATGYNCEGPQGEEVVSIARTGSGGLVATKVVGDACIHAGEVTWRGTLGGKTITGEFHVGEPNSSDRRWLPGSWNVVSKDEIEGFGVRLRRTVR